MEKNFILNRRTVLGGAAALGTVGVLAACGSSKDSKATTKGATVGTDTKELYDLAEAAVSELKDGGTLRLAIPGIGPDFNLFSADGNSLYTQTAMSPVAYAGLWQGDPMGKRTLAPDFAKSFDVAEENGLPVVSIELNPQAKFNDGTPIDYKALQATWEVLKSTDGGYKIGTSGIYSSIASVERDGDDFKVKVTFSAPYYPLETLFAGIMHPALLDKELFNTGFVDKPHPEYWVGPFTIAEGGWNSTEKTLTLTRNDKWWGEKPKLDRIVVREMADPAARAAYKNGELDAVEARTLSAYNEMKDVANSEIRRGHRLFAGGMNLNAQHITDAAVRKAIFLGIDRGALAKIRFQGLPYEEEVPGSMMLMGSSQYYRDNYPARNPEEARKVLEKAGYTKSGDFYAKDGKTITLKLTTFGDDATTKGQAQTFIQSMKEIGINFELDSRAQSEFSKVVGNREYDVSISGFGLSSEPTSAAEYFYHSKNWNGVGTPEIDAMVDEMVTILDDAKRAEKCNEIEKKHMSEVCLFIPFLNGPDFKACRPKLANYGAFLFRSPDWSSVGWMA